LRRGQAVVVVTLAACGEDFVGLEAIEAHATL
jgi:hypothetical protein